MTGTTHTTSRAGHVPVRRSRWTPLRTGAAVAAGLVVTTAVAASASSLGTVTSDTLGAGTSVVASCDTDGVGVSYATAYGSGHYDVAAVTVTGIAPACTGRALGLTLTGAAGATLLTLAPLTVAGTTAAITVPAPVNAASVTGVAVVIA